MRRAGEGSSGRAGAVGAPAPSAALFLFFLLTTLVPWAGPALASHLPGADLSVAMSASASQVMRGETVTFTVTVANGGTSAATSVTLTDIVADRFTRSFGGFVPFKGSTIESANPSQGACVVGPLVDPAAGQHVTASNQKAVCALGTIGAGASATVAVAVVAQLNTFAVEQSVGAFSNVATVSSASTDLHPENNSAQATTTVLATALAVSDAQVAEGNAGTTSPATFAVSLMGGPLHSVVTATVATVAGSATPGSDYAAAPASTGFIPGTTTLVFPPGVESHNVVVVVNGDNTIEPRESFTLRVTSTTVPVLDGDGLGLIHPDDNAISIGDVEGIEGSTSGGTTSFVFPLSRYDSSGANLSLTSSVTAATAGDSAVSGSDFTAVTTSVSFGSGATSGTLTVSVKHDSLVEGNEMFFVNLTAGSNSAVDDGQAVALIIDDDEAFSIADASVVEGNSGITSVLLTVTRSGATSSSVSVKYETQNGTAKSNPGQNDYIAAAGTLSFGSGVTTRTISISVNGDLVLEADEAFFVNLLEPSAGTTVADGSGKVTILNDD